nr:hypothetical protein [Tanacetum cinerariifolium]
SSVKAEIICTLARQPIRFAAIAGVSSFSRFALYLSSFSFAPIDFWYGLNEITDYHAGLKSPVPWWASTTALVFAAMAGRIPFVDAFLMLMLLLTLAMVREFEGYGCLWFGHMCFTPNGGIYGLRFDGLCMLTMCFADEEVGEIWYITGVRVCDMEYLFVVGECVGG